MAKQTVYITYYNRGTSIINIDIEKEIQLLADKYNAYKNGSGGGLGGRDIDYDVKNIAIANAFVLEVSQYLTKIRINHDIYWGKDNKLEIKFE